MPEDTSKNNPDIEVNYVPLGITRFSFEVDLPDGTVVKTEKVFPHQRETYILDELGRFLNDLVNGVLDNITTIDEYIDKYIESWSIDRLGLTDQAIIRIAVYELVYTDTPDLVCINEAIELSKNYSDEKVSKMINGVLDKIYREKLDTN